MKASGARVSQLVMILSLLFFEFVAFAQSDSIFFGYYKDQPADLALSQIYRADKALEPLYRKHFPNGIKPLIPYRGGSVCYFGPPPRERMVSDMRELFDYVSAPTSPNKRNPTRLIDQFLWVYEWYVQQATEGNFELPTYNNEPVTQEKLKRLGDQLLHDFWQLGMSELTGISQVTNLSVEHQLTVDEYDRQIIRNGKDFLPEKEKAQYRTLSEGLHRKLAQVALDKFLEKFKGSIAYEDDPTILDLWDNFGEQMFWVTLLGEGDAGNVEYGEITYEGKPLDELTYQQLSKKTYVAAAQLNLDEYMKRLQPTEPKHREASECFSDFCLDGWRGDCEVASFVVNGSPLTVDEFNRLKRLASANDAQEYLDDFLETFRDDPCDAKNLLGNFVRAHAQSGVPFTDFEIKPTPGSSESQKTRLTQTQLSGWAKQISDQCD